MKMNLMKSNIFYPIYLRKENNIYIDLEEKNGITFEIFFYRNNPSSLPKLVKY